MRKLIAAVAIAASAMAANARSLLYYYDFDKVENGALVYTGVNKGTGALEPTFKQSGSNPLGFVSGGALGSGYALSESSPSSLWLGDGSASLGCSTDRGFTISFWVKTSSSHDAWSDFFGFRLNGVDYRIEYIAKNNSNATFYYYPAKTDATNPTVRLDGSGTTTISELTAGVWKHVAFVAKPNGTNSVGTCSFYVDGKHIANINFFRGGNLQQLHIGSTVRRQLYDGNDRATNTGGTCLDELALFDYPATDEQVKWLAKYKPAQPASGPGRAMPVAWNFDTTNTTVGVAAGNNGSGPDEALLWGGNNPKATASSGGALDSAYCMAVNNKATWRVFNADGVGATPGSGYTMSFWLKAKAKPTAWHDFFYYSLGNQDWATRFEWYSDNPAHVHAYGHYLTHTSAFTRSAETVDTWQHVCLVWNQSNMTTDVYFGGSRTAQIPFSTQPSSSEPLTTIMLGSQSYDDTKSWRSVGGDSGVFVDEFALFNHSLSASQIQWLTNNIPCLPPLDATNLVRTVTTSGAWAGGLASWTVRDWDEVGEAWTDTTRTTIYPTLEDTEVEVAVAFADGVVITNDTFVTPKKLSLAAATSAALPVSATLKCAEDSRFAPEALEIGDGLQLTVPLYDAKVVGTLTFGADAKIVFDVSNYDGGDVALVTDGIALPSGESDVLAHFGVTDSRFALSLSDDGKTVYARLDNVAATATWTGAGDGTSLSSAANWECRNGSGTLLTGDDALPCELTRVIVCSASGVLNAPVGTVIPWQYLRIEAGNATLAADADWRGIPVLCVPEGVTVDLNGHSLKMPPFSGNGVVTNSVAGDAAPFYVYVPEGESLRNEDTAIGGNLRFIKEGAGNYIAVKRDQGYTGGTLVNDGAIICATRGQNRPTGERGSTIEIGPDGVFDVDGYVAYHLYAFVLNGGVLKSSLAIRETGWTMWSNVRLTADSIIELGGNYGFANDAYGMATLDLGGNRLTVKLNSSSVNFQLYNTQVLNGSIENTSGGYIHVYNTNGDSGSSTFDFKAAIALNLERALVVRDYVAQNKWTGSNAGTGVVKVHRVFKPTAAAEGCYHSCQMQNGSTMDLTDWPSDKGWPMYSRFTSGGKQLSFANGTVNVKLDSTRADVKALAKTKSDGAYAGYLLKWGTTAGTLATRNTGTTFVLDADSALKYKLKDNGTGLLLMPKGGFVLIVK